MTPHSEPSRISMNSPNKKSLGTLVILFLFNLPAFAAESWRALPNSNSNILFSIDENSLIRDDDIVKFTEKLVYVAPEVKDSSSGKMVKEKIVYRIMNCKDKTQAYLHAQLIAEDGKRLEENFLDEKKLAMISIPPGSLADTELSWACNHRKSSQ